MMTEKLLLPLVSDIGEDITREALDRVGMPWVGQRLFGTVDDTRACYLVHPDSSLVIYDVAPVGLGWYPILCDMGTPTPLERPSDERTELETPMCTGNAPTRSYPRACIYF
jgi:hypothetical protein